MCFSMCATEVGLGDLEAVGCFYHGADTLFALPAQLYAGEENTVRFFGAPANPAAQLM